MVSKGRLRSHGQQDARRLVRLTLERPLRPRCRHLAQIFAARLTNDRCSRGVAAFFPELSGRGPDFAKVAICASLTLARFGGSGLAAQPFERPVSARSGPTSVDHELPTSGQNVFALPSPERAFIPKKPFQGPKSNDIVENQKIVIITGDYLKSIPHSFCLCWRAKTG